MLNWIYGICSECESSEGQDRVGAWWCPVELVGPESVVELSEMRVFLEFVCSRLWRRQRH